MNSYSCEGEDLNLPFFVVCIHANISVVRGNNLLNTENYSPYIDIELTVVGCAIKC